MADESSRAGVSVDGRLFLALLGNGVVAAGSTLGLVSFLEDLRVDPDLTGMDMLELLFIELVSMVSSLALKLKKQLTVSKSRLDQRGKIKKKYLLMTN